MEDRKLVENALDGDDESFEQLIERYADVVSGLAYSRLGNKPDAKDAVQEAFSRALDNLSNLRKPDKFKSWLCGICVRVCKEMIKERQKTTARFEEGRFSFDLSDRPGSEKSPLLRALEELPDKFREAILLFYYEDRSYEEMAEIFDISEAGVNYRLTKARNVLRKKLSDTDGE